jgi:hypothetical protein
LNRTWLRDLSPIADARPTAAPVPKQYGPLKRVTLSDEVGRTLFEEYAAHRQGPRGHEETGWVLLGLREEHEAIVLATLPAGAERNAGVAHVRFNSTAQAMGSRIVRQADRRLTMLGIVHTHPGSLRHPSDGDYQGDSEWVGRLRRGREGVFGIGTADGKDNGDEFLRYLKPHVQCLGSLCLSWYSLREGDATYSPLPCDLTLGPDLARPLHAVWQTVELHAERLDRLYCQQTGVTFEVVPGRQEPTLAVIVPLAEPGHAVRVLLEGKEVRYYVVRNGEIAEVNSQEPQLDRGVYLLLAELAAQL